MPENASEVTAAGIARLAGVGRAAVSNWRRRHADFPKPVGGTETSPSFALTEVEEWLRAQGKLAEVPPRERVWQQLAGDPSAAAPALVRTGCALLLLRERPTLWQELAREDDLALARLLPTALEGVLGGRFGDDRGDLFRTVARIEPEAVPLIRAAVALAAEDGPRAVYDFLLGRLLDTSLRQNPPTPAGTAALMAALAAPAPGRTGENGATTGRTGNDGAADVTGPAGPTVLDPAVGAGALLAAVDGPAVLCAQDSDPELAALAALRLALTAGTTVRAGAADTLRADGFPELAADAVLCHPPFNERNWGHEELAYDPRWEYGLPARTESELAWVQHALARLAPGGTAVLLMPPAAASRRSGRRIRAGLLRRGALRAVIALPVGAAAPYGIPLHLWVLRAPEADRAPAPELLLVDTAALAPPGGGRDRLDPTVRGAVLDAWRSFDASGSGPDQPGVSRSVPVIELLDDDVDLAPARHVPPLDQGAGAHELAGLRERLTDTLRLTIELTPAPVSPGRPTARPTTTVGELARAGALVIHAGTVVPGPASVREPGVEAGRTEPGAGHASVRPSAGTVLTEQDVLAGTHPSAVLTDDQGEEDPVRTAPGDVVVPVLGGGAVVRVVDEATAGTALGRNLHLLRPDPAALDPWFLAGFLRGTANTRQASSYASTASRLDVRRVQLPRLPLADQRRHGERFRALAAFEDALRQAGRLGERLVRGLYDGLTDGTVGPEREGAGQPETG
ncbi:class I SAM-dependent DNA methyltransferase [Streptomyces sp. NPDC057638]|uniref:class I SAM-dependent DNA methyltransferase n=1 Tax=Streptomyces sp. NPDC057638 TaxID=3346190 RepID=UPI0036C599A9